MEEGKRAFKIIQERDLLGCLGVDERTILYIKKGFQYQELDCECGIEPPGSISHVVNVGICSLLHHEFNSRGTRHSLVSITTGHKIDECSVNNNIHKHKHQL
jgi:hypothetical protein